MSENKAESAAGQMQKIFTHTARVMEFIGSKLTRTMKLNQDSLNRQSYLNQLSQLSIHEMCQNCYKNK